MTDKPRDEAGSEDEQPDAEAAGEDTPDVEVTGESWEENIPPEAMARLAAGMMRSNLPRPAPQRHAEA
jgi:hypothetical protein